MNTSNTHRQATMLTILMSNVKASSSFMYCDGSVLVIVIIFADTNIKGALRKVQATIALAIYKTKMYLKLSNQYIYLRLSTDT